MGGFWAALWWRRATAMNGTDVYATARQWTVQLQPMLVEDSVNRGFVFWYGAGIAYESEPDPVWKLLSAKACAQLGAAFDEALRIYPLGQGMGAGPAGNHLLNVDSLAGLLQLMNHHGNPEDQACVKAHLDTCVGRLMQDSGMWYSQISLAADRASDEHTGVSSARGQAWAMLGLAQAMKYYGEPYLAAALQTCRWWVEQQTTEPVMSRGSAQSATPEAVPLADPCASAIACVALGQMHVHAKGHEWLRAAAQRERVRLLKSCFSEDGLFAGHLYSIGPEGEQIVETPCSLYFLLEAIMADERD